MKHCHTPPREHQTTCKVSIPNSRDKKLLLSVYCHYLRMAEIQMMCLLYSDEHDMNVVFHDRVLNKYFVLF